MNEKLLYDIKVAMGKMKEAEKIEASIVNDVKQRRNEIYELQKKCEAVKLGGSRKLVYKTIASFVIVLISLCIMPLTLKMNGNMLLLIGIALFLFGPIVAVSVINGIYKNGTKRSIARADKWWKKYGEPKEIELKVFIENNKRMAEEVIKDDFIISKMHSGNRCSEVLSSMYHMVANGYALNFNDAYRLGVDEVLREIKAQEYRELLRENREWEREERQRQRDAIDNINNNLDRLNKNMAQREFYEDLILMELASRDD